MQMGTIPSRLMMISILMIFGLLTTLNAAIWYVDAAATGTRSGVSWQNAWTGVQQVTGVSPGDRVYISGGPSGGTQTYNLTDSWRPIGGTSGNPVTYQIGQDSQHNGTAIFSHPGDYWIWSSGTAGLQLNYVIVSGDASDGNLHFQANQPVQLQNSTGVRISYVNFGQQKTVFINILASAKIEVDHCYCYKLDAGAGGDDHLITISNNAKSFDDTLLHDCSLYTPNSGSGTGDDCIQGGVSGVSIYNNRIIGYTTTYRNTQHQDGWQALSGSYAKIYNNYFQDIANYAVFGDMYQGSFDHIWVYNNIVCLVSSSLRSSDPPQGIVVGPDGGVFGNLGYWPSITNVIICNNLVVDYGNHTAGGTGNYAPIHSQDAVTGCCQENNIVLNGGDWGTTDSAVINSNNVTIGKMTSGSAHFVAYQQNQANLADFHLVAADTLFRSKGVNLSQFFSADKDGKPRPSTGAWDVGPYQYATENAPQAPTNLRVLANGSP